MVEQNHKIMWSRSICYNTWPNLTRGYSPYQQIPANIVSVVDPPVLLDKLLQSDSLGDIGVVEGRVEHDDGE